VIVDDGWQITSNERGYAYTGDWEPTPEKVPDMRAHVDRVHALGMKFLLWYSVPFVGRHSKAWERFSGMLLQEIERLGASVLDPRFSEAIYPAVLARTESKLAAAAYGNVIVPLEGEIPSMLFLVNGTLEEGVVLYLADDVGTRGIEVRDCRGRVTHKDNIGLETGLHRIDVPPAGVAVLK
jgi:Melibiase